MGALRERCSAGARGASRLPRLRGVRFGTPEFFSCMPPGDGRWRSIAVPLARCLAVAPRQLGGSVL